MKQPQSLVQQGSFLNIRVYELTTNWMLHIKTHEEQMKARAIAACNGR